MNARQRKKAEKGPKRVYVNVYLVDRAFGGHEEGGWYYDYGIPVEPVMTRPVGERSMRYRDYKRQAEEFCEKMNEGRRPIYSVLSEGIYRVSIEPTPARPWPGTIPHYE